MLLTSLKIPTPPLGFDNNVDAQVVSNSTVRMMLQIDSSKLKNGNQCRVNDGNAIYYAAIEDKDFIAGMNTGKRPEKGDMLLVDLRQVQSIVGKRLISQSFIARVIERRPRLP